MGKLVAKGAKSTKQILIRLDDDTLVRSLSDQGSQNLNWWEELPVKVRKDIEVGLAQADANRTISHAAAMKRIEQWQIR